MLFRSIHPFAVSDPLRGDGTPLGGRWRLLSERRQGRQCEKARGTGKTRHRPQHQTRQTHGRFDAHARTAGPRWALKKAVVRAQAVDAAVGSYLIGMPSLT